MGSERPDTEVWWDPLLAVDGFEEAMMPFRGEFSGVQNIAEVFDAEGSRELCSFMALANKRWVEDTKPFTPPADVLGALQAKVEEMGDEVFGTWIEAGDREGPSCSFRQAWDAAGAVAHTLVNGWGVKPGDRVLLCYNFGFDFFFAFLGCLRAGAVAVPAYPIDPTRMDSAVRRFRTLVDEVGATVCLTDRLINRVRLVCTLLYSGVMPKDLQWHTTDHLMHRKGLSYDHRGRRPEDVAYVQYTSGCTSEPKGILSATRVYTVVPAMMRGPVTLLTVRMGVMVTFASLAANLGLISGAQRMAFHYADLLPRNTRYRQQTVTRPCSVSWLPMMEGMGLVMGVLSQFYLGSRMYYMSPLTFLRDPCSWVRLLARYNCHWAAGPDFAYRLITRKWDAKRWPPDQYRLDSILYAHTSAEPVRQSTLDGFNRIFRPYGLHRRALCPCYGLGESVVCVSWFDPIANPPATLTSRHPGYLCVGADLMVDVRIADPHTRREVAEGEAGEIWVSGPSVAAGYWGRPAESEEVFRAELAVDGQGPRPGGRYLRTGDLGFVSDGRVYLLGRRHDVITLGDGQMLYAQDVEYPAAEAWAAIRAGCVAAFATNQPEAGSGEALVVVFELASGQHTTASLGEGVQRVAEAVEKSAGVRPWRLVVIKDRTIPKTTSGKVRRAATREALAAEELCVVYDSLHPQGLVKRRASALSRLAGRLSGYLDPLKALEDVLALFRRT